MTKVRMAREDYLAGHHARSDSMLARYEASRVVGPKLTMQMLADEAGVSIARVSQLLAGARKRRAARLQAEPA